MQIVNFSIKFTQKPKKKKHVTLNCELAGFFFFISKVGKSFHEEAMQVYVIFVFQVSYNGLLEW